MYGKKENPYAVLWLSNASVKDGERKRKGGQTLREHWSSENCFE